MGDCETSQQQRTRLPELTVSKFGGEFLKWPEFKSMFQTVISDRSGLSNLEKFQYLKGALTGPAAQLIANIPPAGESLPVAWQLLTTRFENHRLTVKSHLDRVFSLQPVKGRNVKALQRVLNTVNETIQTLKALKIAPTSDCVLVHLVTSLLDQDTRSHHNSKASQPMLQLFGETQCSQVPVHQTLQDMWPEASHHATWGRPLTIVLLTKRIFSGTVSLVINFAHLLNKVASNSKHSMNDWCSRRQAFSRTQPVVSSDISSPTSTLLATAVASIRLAVTSHEVRLLIDQGSELSFVAEHLVRLLNLSRRSSSIEIVGIDGQRVTHTRGLATLSLHSNTRELTLNIDAHILTTLSTVLPSFVAIHQNWPHLKNLKLADPDFLTPRSIDIIVRANYYGQVIKPNIIKLSQDAPIAQLSIFGWLVLGPVRAHLALRKTSHHATIKPSTQHLEDLLIKFWQMEEPPSIKTYQLSPEEAECEQHFISTHSRDSSGRYIVRIPFKSSPARLGNPFFYTWGKPSKGLLGLPS
ncbi:hypothetical protein KPH14_000959 [Odynerus spinipes]|uniref:Peptidase aspartic putative domain-containing protein n=1 Tax=Odynerus spinipes TaxID=1348599 RepID=A0AAD9R8R3_9HYME|nr:hypothetical protein KPH14_000959 [Odynerus spinipes]